MDSRTCIKIQPVEKFQANYEAIEHLMTTAQKPRVRVAAGSNPLQSAALQLIEKAVDMADAVDIQEDGQPYNPDFQAGLNHLPNGREVPRTAPVRMSGDGAENMTGRFSELANQQQSLMRAFATFAETLNRTQDAAKADRAMFGKALALVLARSGMADAANAMLKATTEEDSEQEPGTKRQKGPNWMASDAAEKAFNAAEAAAAEGNIASKSINQVLDEAFGMSRTSGQPGLVMPPDMTGGAMRKSALTAAEFDSTLDNLTPSERTEAATLRARLAAVGHVPGFTAEKAKSGISAKVISACFPHLA